MSSDASSSISPATTPRYIPIIDKAPPRPAPTLEYTWRDYNSDAQVLYIRDHVEANKQLSRLPESANILGFDLEWKPTFRRGGRENPVALVQLANDKTIFLLQITSMKEFPEKLGQLLANPLVVKTGVAIQSDAKKIYNDWKIPMANCVDLSLLARTVDNARWAGKYNSSLGLARLVEAYEYRLLAKGSTTRSNWEAKLDALQIEYACNDAHAGFILYQKLAALQAAMPVQPKTTWFTFKYTSGYMQDEEGFPWQPQNPNYDPGPQPPPREPREGDAERALKRARHREARLEQQRPAVNIQQSTPEMRFVRPAVIPPGIYGTPLDTQQIRQQQQQQHAPPMGFASHSAIPLGIYHRPGEHPQHQQTFAVYSGVSATPQNEWTTQYNRPGEHPHLNPQRDHSQGDHPREYVHDDAVWPATVSIPRASDGDKQTMSPTDRTFQAQEHSYYDRPYNGPSAPAYYNAMNQSMPVYNDWSSGMVYNVNLGNPLYGNPSGMMHGDWANGFAYGGMPNGATLHSQNPHAAWLDQQPRGGAPSHAVPAWGRAPPQGFQQRTQNNGRGRGRPAGRGTPRNTAPAK